jgi:hypothetical protein
MPIRLNGSTSGYSELSAPAVAGDQTFALPGTGGTLDRLNRAGNILQVVSTTKLNAFSSTSGTMVDITGLSLSITPTSSSSKILILASLIVGVDSWTSQGIAINLVRGSTSLATGTNGSTINATSGYNAYGGSLGNTYANFSPMVISYLDSPASTSSLTYKLQGRTLITAGYEWDINRRMVDNSCGFSSTITAMEVAA